MVPQRRFDQCPILRNFPGIEVFRLYGIKSVRFYILTGNSPNQRSICPSERGDVSASVTVLGQIANALEIEPGELLKKACAPK